MEPSNINVCKKKFFMTKVALIESEGRFLRNSEVKKESFSPLVFALLFTHYFDCMNLRVPIAKKKINKKIVETSNILTPVPWVTER